MQWAAKSRKAWENCKTRFVCGKVFSRELSDSCSDLAWDSARLQETLMDGILQKLLVIIGHGCVAAASSAVVTGRHHEH